MRLMVWPMVLISIQLTACGIGGHWMTGDPSAGRDAKPHLQYFEKPGWTPEERRRDSEACGAIGLDDRADIAESRIQAEQRPGETLGLTRARLGKNWHDCMVEKGYRGVRATPK